MKNEAILQNLSEFENKSLLIVDDDNPFRERLARAMEKKGFQVFQAEGVQKGIESVKSKKPIGNGILTCLNMNQAKVRKKKGAEAAKATISVLSQK